MKTKTFQRISCCNLIFVMLIICVFSVMVLGERQTRAEAVTLNAPTEITSNSMTLSWTESTDAEFSAYKLYRDTQSPVTASSKLVTTINVSSTLSFTDTGLKERTTYFYRIYIVNTSGFSNGSNEVNGTTLNEVPTAVTLNEPMQITIYSITLSWSESSDDDFEAYRLYRDSQSLINESSTLITIIKEKTTLTFTDTDLKSETTYYYKIYVEDENGLSNGSNMVNGTTLPAPPEAVTLNEPMEITNNSMKLSWSASTELDFQAYKLFRNRTTPITELSTLVTTINLNNTISYTDTGLASNTTYYYRIFVLDTNGLTTGSNEVTGTTLTRPIIDNKPPTVDAGKNQTVKVDEKVKFTGNGEDSDGIIAKYEWDFDGDGKYDWGNTTTGEIKYKYKKPGTYTALLRVTDNDGATANDTITIVVEEKEEPGFLPGFETLILLVAMSISLSIMVLVKRLRM